MISEGLVLAFATGAGGLAAQLAGEGAALACANAGFAAATQDAGPPTTELMASGEFPAKWPRVLLRRPRTYRALRDARDG